MTIEEYIKALEKLKYDAERAVISQLPGLEAQALQLVVEMVGEFNTKDGRLFADADSRKLINSFTDVYITAFTELQDYQGMISKYLKNFKPIGQLMQEFNAERGLDPKKATVGAAQEVVIGEIIDRYTANGLNEGFVQPMRDLLFNNVAGGLNKRQAIKQLKGFIIGGQDTSGKLHSYIEQTAQQGVDSYEGATNTRIMQAYDIDTMIMAGSLIKTSSPQCKYCINKLGGLLDRENWDDIKAIAEDNGLIEGTTFDNLPFNKLHWGCRHSFTPAVLRPQERSKFTSLKPLL